MKIKGSIAMKLYPNKMYVDLETCEKIEKQVEEYKSEAAKFWGFCKDWEKDYNKLKKKNKELLEELQKLDDDKTAALEKVRKLKTKNAKLEARVRDLNKYLRFNYNDVCEE